MPELDQKLIETKNRIVELFMELKAEGVDVLIMVQYGSQPALVIHSGLDRATPADWTQITNEHWHPEWAHD